MTDPSDMKIPWNVLYLYQKLTLGIHSLSSIHSIENIDYH